MARSREDNLALPFFRDGIRSMSLQPGTDAREVGALLDAMSGWGIGVTRIAPVSDPDALFPAAD